MQILKLDNSVQILYLQFYLTAHGALNNLPTGTELSTKVCV